MTQYLLSNQQEALESDIEYIIHGNELNTNTDDSDLNVAKLPSILQTCKMRSQALLMIFLVFLGIFCYFHFATTIFTQMMPAANNDNWWIYRLCSNLIGYCTVVIPLWILYRTLKQKGVLANAESQGQNNWLRVMSLLYINKPVSDLPSSNNPSTNSPKLDSNKFNQYPFVSYFPPWTREYILLAGCFLGLQFSYLTWGVVQERIMTQPFTKSNTFIQYEHGGHSDRFTDSQFLVFVNRLSSFTFSGLFILLLYKRQPVHRAALYNYAYASFSNIMSSWCAYEALKFVTFPTQTLGKACKIIPVMLMGKLLNRNTQYRTDEYMTAALLSAGVSLFLLSREQGASHKQAADNTSLSGLLLMAGYISFDAFTSNWQGSLFREYRMSSLQMMCGVNLFSLSLTLVSLIEQGNFMHSCYFLLTHDGIAWNCLLMSLCSAIGQLCIFSTISLFGAVTFTVIMTVRMALSILLSCVLYGHKLGWLGVLGIMLAIGTTFLRQYFNIRAKRTRTERRVMPELLTNVHVDGK